MGEIVPRPDQDANRLRVRMSPEDILRHPYLVDGEQAEMFIDSGKTIQDAIRLIAWKQVYLHAPHLIEKELYRFADVTVLDGEFVIYFFKQLPKAMHKPDKQVKEP
jgi:hypothetical protein